MKLFENLSTRELANLSEEAMHQYALEGIYSLEEIRETVEDAKEELANI